MGYVSFREGILVQYIILISPLLSHHFKSIVYPFKTKCAQFMLHISEEISKWTLKIMLRNFPSRMDFLMSNPPANIISPQITTQPLRLAVKRILEKVTKYSLTADFIGDLSIYQGIKGRLVLKPSLFAHHFLGNYDHSWLILLITFFF